MSENTTHNEFAPPKMASYLAVYGIGHALIDAICAGIVLTLWSRAELSPAKISTLFIYYNLLAFGSQPFFGALLDKIRMPRFGAVLGCILTGSAMFFFTTFPTLAVTLAGVGNALFHLGAGTISLNLTPGRATAPGIFVAPGALGLAAGIGLGKAGLFTPWPFLALLAPIALLTAVLVPPAIDYERPRKSDSTPLQWLAPALFLILMCVVIRALVGTTLSFPWKTNLGLLAVLTGAVVMGKGVGGLLADRFGWARVAAGGLALSIPFLTFAPHIAGLAIIGAFLFNLTMPVTLAATANLLKGRPGLAFGLTCLALEIGSWPSKLPICRWGIPGGEWASIAVMVFGLTTLYFGLHLSFTRLPRRFAGVRP